MLSVCGGGAEVEGWREGAVCGAEGPVYIFDPEAGGFTCSVEE